MMNKILCSVCYETIAYTNRKISQPTAKYLTSEKLTLDQKGAFHDRRKLIYCTKCYNKGVVQAKKELEITTTTT